jgi:hypothetical protein
MAGSDLTRRDKAGKDVTGRDRDKGMKADRHDG